MTDVGLTFAGGLVKRNTRLVMLCSQEPGIIRSVAALRLSIISPRLVLTNCEQLTCLSNQTAGKRVP